MISYLLRFFLVYIHRRYFFTLYRSAILLSHRFGLAVMFKSFFKPLFGMSGFLSRINGIVIRSLSIVLAFIIILGYILIGVLGYFGFYALLLHFLISGSFVYFISIIGFVFLCGVYNYYYFNPIVIAGKVVLVNWNIESLYSSAKNGNVKPLLASIDNADDIKVFLLRAELPYDDTFKFIESELNKFNADRFSATISEFASQSVFLDKRLNIADLFCAYLLQTETLSSLLNKYRVDEDILVATLKFMHNLKSHEPQVWDPDFNIPPSGGIDKGWAIAYTPAINKSGVDLTKLALNGSLPKLIGRHDVEDSVISVLSKPSSNNVLLIGNAGSGKTTFIKALAREIALGTSIPALKYKRIISIDIGALTSGKSADTNKVTSQIAKEAEMAGNIILFIDEIHSLATLSSNDPNASPIFAILEPFLSSAKFQFIGTTSYDNYLRYIKPNESFARTFDVIELRETTDEETVMLMQDYAKNIEPSRKFKFTYPALKTVLESGKRYVNDRAMPDKALSLLTQSYTNDPDKIVTKNDILNFVSSRFKIPVKSIDADEKEILLNIEGLMRKKIIGQDQAITLISKALKRARAGVRNENKPIASFLFAGPTGVGKTETAKVLAETYFGDKTRMIRVDMSEYQTPDSINRLLGDTTGQVGFLIAKIQENPHSVILLDEIEKADKNILNLFLQVLDDGRLTSASGKTYDFTNSFIIMTTNVGTKAITQSIVDSTVDISEVALRELKAYFPIEFLNRFTALVPYSLLTKDDVFGITQIKLKALQEKIQEKKITVEFSEEVIREIAELGYSPEWGARELNRFIEDKVETVIAEKMIAGEINSGDTYKFDMIH